MNQQPFPLTRAHYRTRMVLHGKGVDLRFRRLFSRWLTKWRVTSLKGTFLNFHAIWPHFTPFGWIIGSIGSINRAKKRNEGTTHKLQGDHSTCSKPPVDFKTKLPFWPGQARPKRNFFFWSQREVLNKWNGHPVHFRADELHNIIERNVAECNLTR